LNAFAEGLICTTPYHNNSHTTQNIWQGVPKVGTKDVDFTLQLLDHLTQTYAVNASRIYATGKSDGGGLTGVLACDPAASKRFAAFAPVSGAFYTTTLAADCRHPGNISIECSPTKSRLPIPFIEFHGGQDDTIGYNGGKKRGVCLPSIPHYVTEWSVRDNLGTTNTKKSVANDTVVYTFGDGMVRGYYSENVKHDWPSTTPNADNSRPGHSVAPYDATPIILDFFKQYTLP
jgi:poly(3-hydroxybutyrate) depolymerase